MKDFRLNEHTMVHAITYGMRDDQFKYTYVIDERWPDRRQELEHKKHAAKAARIERAKGLSH